MLLQEFKCVFSFLTLIKVLYLYYVDSYKSMANIKIPIYKKNILAQLKMTLPVIVWE